MPFIQIQNQRVLFVHIPKTGGSSVTRWMQDLGRVRLHGNTKPEGLKVTSQHLTWTDIDAMWGCDDFDYVFTVVRNPFTRMASEFGMRQKLREQGFFGGSMHFPSWLERALIDTRNNANHFDNHIRPQWTFISDRMRVFRFEDGMETILRAVSADLGLPAPASVPHMLSSADPQRAPLTWDRGDILRMREFYQQDFEQFGYDIEPLESQPE
ncbi:sulfotransferase family 2 domain-containing protein [Paracoccus pacificus]|uniref:Sulfotransferase family 2 domain-containing protein n=1 Tax=Paracoccus pacificus TaxID=1463598 RepID=A0ABW4R2H6_9RHOB